MDAPPAPYHSILDAEIDALIHQVKEISRYRESRKGKSREDDLSDHDIATLNFLHELKTRITLLSDQRFANSVALAVEADANAIAAISQQERQAENDRRLALHVDANPDTRILKRPGSRLIREAPKAAKLRHPDPESVVDEFLSNINVEPEITGGPSMTYVQRQAAAIKKMSMVQCCVCYDSFHPSKTTRLQCDHVYCTNCLKSLFLKATSDEALFPPKCCRGLIPVESIQTEMSATEIEEFRRAQVEFSTTDRTYCSNTDCRNFIAPANITAGQAQCPYCNSVTCAMCKKTFHTDDCPADANLQAVLALADAESWKRCYSCRALVELSLGCNHITCHCKEEFCYPCGVHWKNCECAVWDENKLLAKAEEVVDREATNGPLPAVEREQRVARMREDLRRNLECNHLGVFKRLEINPDSRRGLACDMCSQRHRQFILRCRHCHIQVCEACRKTCTHEDKNA